MTCQYEKIPVPQCMLHDGQYSQCLQQSGSVLTFTEIGVSPTQCQGTSKQQTATGAASFSELFPAFRSISVPSSSWATSLFLLHSLTLQVTAHQVIECLQLLTQSQSVISHTAESSATTPRKQQISNSIFEAQWSLYVPQV